MFLQCQLNDYGTVVEVSLTITLDGEMKTLKATEDVGSGPSKGVINEAYVRCKARLLDALVSAARTDSHVEIVRTKPIDADALASRKTA